MTGAMNMKNAAENLRGARGFVTAQASVTAGAFFGSGAALTGIPSTAAINTLVAGYVPLTGGTMTGALNMNNAAVNLTGVGGFVTSQASVTAGAFFGSGAALTGIPSTAAITSLVGGYVPLGGGTMTGALNMNNAAVNLTGAGGFVTSQSSVTASAFFGAGETLT